MDNLQYILQQIFRREHLDEVPVEVLEKLSQEHPLFAPFQFLLAKKYKQSGNEAYGKQIRKTALHFHNPLWLHYHLREDGSNGYHRPAATVEPVPLTAEPTQEAVNISHDLIEDVVIHQENQPGHETTADGSVDEQAIASPHSTEGADDAHIGELYNTNPESEALKLEETEAKKEIREANDNAAAATEQVPSGNAEEAPVSSASTPKHPLFSKVNEDDAEETKPTFEPFHTVDYFASQGIKVATEFKTEDRLGKQLKSFTEWLKTMRKLPEARVEAELEKINDREIESIAAHSLEEKEVVTEAMAEVFAKQGLHAEAAEVYRKLSLLNPAKSVYFGAKIDAIKNQ